MAVSNFDIFILVQLTVSRRRGFTSGRLAKDCDPVRVATEMSDVVANPFDCKALISQAGILRAFRPESIRLGESKY